MILVASHNNENECVCEHHEFRGGSLEYKVNHLVMGRSHDHLCKWLRVQLPKIEYVLKTIKANYNGSNMSSCGKLVLVLKKILNNLFSAL